MDELQPLLAAGVLQPLDVHFARALARLAGGDDPALRLAAALASHLREAGHVCVDLARWADTPVRGPEGEAVVDLRWPALEPWVAALGRSAAVDAGAAPVPSATPLVLDRGGRLYLRRLFEEQQRLALALLVRASAPVPALDGPRLREGLDRLFGVGSRGLDHPAHGQRRAALLALLRPLCVITGGPGTGKTTTVASVLALLAEQAQASGAPLPVARLLAPTGKAAARLVEALRGARERLPLAPGVRAALPLEAATIHRALGPLGGSSSRFRHHAGNPLPADLVLVDEASMVDLPLMTRLLDALGASTRLVLLGDRDQLTSVEAGAILGDLCGPVSLGVPAYGPLLVERARALAGEELRLHPDAPARFTVRDSVAPLTHSFRFGATSGIGRLAGAVSHGDAEGALALLGDPAYPDVRLVELPGAASAGPPGRGAEPGRQALLALLEQGYGPYLAAQGAEARLHALARFRVLCAHRRGPWGAEALNAAFEAPLARDGRPRAGAWYDGRPILITENHYGLGLWNGDVGVVCVESSADGASVEADPERSFRTFFPTPDGPPRALAPARLPGHEPVFATSVHKSQGSEFDEVLVVLPELVSRVLTRELLYTAVTRARQRVVVVARPEVLRATIARRVDRASGLQALLWDSATS